MPIIFHSLTRPLIVWHKCLETFHDTNAWFRSGIIELQIQVISHTFHLFINLLTRMLDHEAEEQAFFNVHLLI
jgi:hypothetical protein